MSEGNSGITLDILVELLHGARYQIVLIPSLLILIFILIKLLFKKCNKSFFMDIMNIY